MFNISDFLEKFKKFDQDKDTQTQKISEIIEKTIGIKVEKKNFEVKGGVLRIIGSPSMRQEVFLKKESLLPLLLAEGIFDIR